MADGEHLLGDERFHQVDGDVRPAEAGRPLPGVVGERYVGIGEEAARRGGCWVGGERVGERERMHQVVGEVLGALLARGARHRPITDVGVDLLCPEPDPAGDVAPERRVAQPAAQVRLVDVQRGGRLANPGHEHQSGRAAAAVVKTTDEIGRVRPRTGLPLPHPRPELVQRPRLVTGGKQPMPGLDPGAVVGVRRVAGDPSLPGRIVDLRHRMEMHAKLADPVRLVGPHHRLVPHYRRHRDVEVDAGRAVERKRTHQPQPIGRSVEGDLRAVAAIRRQRIGGPARLCDRCHHLRSVGRVEIRHWIESRAVDDRQRRRPRLATIRPRRRIICTRRCHHHEHHCRDRHHRQDGQRPPEEPVHDPLLP